jgi:hypothetical protein
VTTLHPLALALSGLERKLLTIGVVPCFQQNTGCSSWGVEIVEPGSKIFLGVGLNFIIGIGFAYARVERG